MEKIKNNIVFVLPFILIVLISTFYTIVKNYIDVSEAYSIGTANNPVLYMQKLDNLKGEFTGNEIRAQILLPQKSFRKNLNDFKLLYLKHLDPSHTNLYYTALKLVNFNAVSPEILNFNLRALALNVIFFAIAYFYMFKLLALIYDKEKDKIFITLSLLFVFSSFSVINCIILIREYEMQTMFYIILAYLFAKTLKEIFENRFNFKSKKLVLTSLIIALTLCSGYLSLIYIFILTITLVAIALKYQNKKLLKFIALGALLSIIFTFLICPHWLEGIFYTNNEVEIFNILNNKTYISNWINSLCLLTKTLNSFVFDNLILKLFLFLLPFLILKFKNKNYSTKVKIITIIFSLAYLYLCSLSFLIFRFNCDRYIMSIVPISLLIIPFVCKNFKFKTFLICCFCIINLITLLNPENFQKFTINNLFNDSEKYKKLANFTDHIGIDPSIIYTVTDIKKVNIFTYKYGNYELNLYITCLDKNRIYNINPDKIETKNCYLINIFPNEIDSNILKHFKPINVNEELFPCFKLYESKN